MVEHRRKDLITLLFSLIAIIIINILASHFFTRIDFTAEKRYTLSPITKDILKNLDDNIQITVYLEGDEFPPAFRRLRSSTFDVLADFKAYSGNKLSIDFVNPMAGDQRAQQENYQKLMETGIEPTNLNVTTESGNSQKIIFPAALVTYKGVQIPVKLLQTQKGVDPQEVLNNSIQNLEYAFASTIKKASSGGRQRIGLTEGHGELTDLQLSDAMNSLADWSEVGRVDLGTISFEGLDKLRLLIIAKPDRQFTEAEKYKIDYFVMRGGRVLWAIDQVSAELDSLRGAGEQLAFGKKLNLDDMLFRYGARINYDLIADLNSAQIPLNVGAVAGQPQIQLLPWMFYPIFMPVSTHPLVKNLDGIRSEFPSTIDLIDVKGIRGEVVLASSPYNRKIDVPTMLSLQMVEQEPDPKLFQGAPKAAGVLLEGEFPSVFRNRARPVGVSGAAVIPPVSKPGKMLVIADGDILKNQINASDGSHYPLGFDRYTQEQYANKNFLLNAADYLMDDSGIIGLRNKEIKLRLLDRTKIRAEKTFWQVVNLGLPLIMLIACGIFQHYFRIRKYAR
ncbi:gliding motility-associated ABC transporter substrate-binding protein GldG [Daejeonella lutea]|uniref:ABC-2 type transport system permease protein n=1 Tax=Daejeonella lutea TaxID=572036 RepID=A0A1T4ZY94_9SPHI|nr:gliding motility-associated ABC transporter substrate-binding protein GldG [Daejeonella lutea]SKB27700.1 ABC-2 type transport system permease protein [Daejeonella lutea]